MMTEALQLKGTERVLEVGTGSGYQTAILAELARQVITVERHPELSEGAQLLLNSLGYSNIEFHLSKDTLGWPEGAPYDAILVTAGAPQVPQELLTQLAVGGRIVIPVGSRYEQDLLCVTKRHDGNIVRNLGACRFVPLVSKGAWSEEGY
jgi:protein-L-isoaspartate(D-aspartate) O-methyltransferase